MVPFSILGFIGAKDDVGGGNKCIVCIVQSSSQIVIINKPNTHLFTGQMPPPPVAQSHNYIYGCHVYSHFVYFMLSVYQSMNLFAKTWENNTCNGLKQAGHQGQ